MKIEDYRVHSFSIQPLNDSIKQLPSQKFFECSTTTSHSCPQTITDFFQWIWKALCGLFCCSKGKEEKPTSITLTPEAKIMFRGLKETQWKDLEQSLLNLDLPRKDPKTYIDRLNVFRNEDYKNAIFQQKDWPLYAMQAYANGDLTDTKYASLMLYKTAQDFALTCSGSFNIHNLNMDDGKALFIQGLRTYLTEEEQNRFFSSLKKIAPEDQYFFSVYLSDFATKEPQENNKASSLLESFYHSDKFQLFTVDHPEKGILQIVLPPHICHLLLQAKFQDAAPKQELIIGYSDQPKKEGIYDLHIPHPQIKCREMDDFPFAESLEIYQRDLFWMWMKSMNIHQLLYSQLAEFFKEKNAHTYEGLTNGFTNAVYVNQELNNPFGKQLSQSECFWMNMLMLLFLTPDSLEKEEEKKPKIIDQQTLKENFNILLKFIDKNSSAKELGINFKSLQSFFENIQKGDEEFKDLFQPVYEEFKKYLG